MDHNKPIAWIGLISALVLTLAYPVLLYLDQATRFQVFGFPGLDALLYLFSAAVGAVIVARQPRNAIGWMMLFIGVTGQLDNDAQLYSLLAFKVHHRDLVAGAFSAWLGTWLFVPGSSLEATLVLLLFPNGRLPSPRWRVLMWASAAAVALAAVTAAIGAIPRSPNFTIDTGGVIESSYRSGTTRRPASCPYRSGWRAWPG